MGSEDSVNHFDYEEVIEGFVLVAGEKMFWLEPLSTKVAAIRQ